MIRALRLATASLIAAAAVVLVAPGKVGAQPTPSPPPTPPGADLSDVGVNPADCPAGLQSHAPIVIGSDADFTAANGVTGGSGTAADPYVINCWSFQLAVLGGGT